VQGQQRASGQGQAGEEGGQATRLMKGEVGGSADAER
jgi:hypothetical protein